MDSSTISLPRLLPAQTSSTKFRATTLSPGRGFQRPHGRIGVTLPEGDSFSASLLATLLGATAVSVVYSLAQLWHVMGGETLDRMVRTFLP